jgi:hypothetical protein
VLAHSLVSVHYMPCMRQRDEQILCHLIRPEAQCTSRTFHDCFWAQTTEDTGLVVLTWVQVGDDGIVGSRQLCLTCWTPSVLRGRPIEPGAADAVNTKNMTVGFLSLAKLARGLDTRGLGYLQVVTKALSRSSPRHLISLHLRACSILLSEPKSAVVVVHQKALRQSWHLLGAQLLVLMLRDKMNYRRLLFLGKRPKSCSCMLSIDTEKGPWLPFWCPKDVPAGVLLLLLQYCCGPSLVSCAQIWQCGYHSISSSAWQLPHMSCCASPNCG